MKNISYAALAGLLALGACKNSLGDIPTSRPTGIVTLGTGDAVNGIHEMRPSAYFVDAVNVSIPSSRTINDQCVQIPYPGTGQLAPLSQINAGPQVTVATAADTAQLLPAPADVNGYVFYQLPTNDSMRVTPGEQVHLTIPGASGGFDPFDFSALGPDSLFVHPIEASSDSTGVLPILWNPQTPGTTSVVVELEFSVSPTGTAPNTQIFCSFNDDGQDTVSAQLSNLWRSGGARHVHAYRWVTTVTSNANQQVVAIAQYSTDSTHIVP